MNALDLKELDMDLWRLSSIILLEDMEAELIPLKDEAIREVQELCGRCFMFQWRLWQIYKIEVSPSEQGGLTVKISCLPVWGSQG